jgi:DNA-binding MarR family transcriptional regulator
MQEIERAPGVSVAELARRLAIHQAICSHLVEKLVRRSYVGKERSTQDQRCVGLTLSRRAIKASENPIHRSTRINLSTGSESELIRALRR